MPTNMGWKTLLGGLVTFLCGLTDPTIVPQIAALLPSQAVVVTRVLGLLGLLLTLYGVRHAQAKVITAIQDTCGLQLPLPAPPDVPPRVGGSSVSGVIGKVAIVLLAMLLVSCGANARQRALTASMRTVDAAAGGFTAWDEQHQQDLVQSSNTHELGAAALASYRQHQAEVVGGLELAYRAIAAAALGTGDLAGAEDAVVKAIDEIHTLETTP
jgi:hypothetical protein